MALLSDNYHFPLGMVFLVDIWSYSSHDYRVTILGMFIVEVEIWVPRSAARHLLSSLLI